MTSGERLGGRAAILGRAVQEGEQLAYGKGARTIAIGGNKGAQHPNVSVMGGRRGVRGCVEGKRKGDTPDKLTQLALARSLTRG